MKKLALILLSLITIFTMPAISQFAPSVEASSTSQFEKENKNYIQDYKAIPGVTKEEIDAITKMQKEGRTFTYASMESSESFFFEDGSRGGFSVEMCQLFSDMFDLQFEPECYFWDEILEGLDDGTIDFAAELTATEERLEIYHMTTAIIERTITTFSKKGSHSLESIAEERPVKLAFLEGVITGEQVKKVTDWEIEITEVQDYDEAAALIYEDKVDAFLEELPAMFYLEDYDFLQIEGFFPLIYSPVSLTTAKDENAPIISIVQKYLDAGGINYLAQLYAQGNWEYNRNKLNESFTIEEKQFLKKYAGSNTPVPIAAEADNYPISFYNEQEDEYQGIALDILNEISTYTDLTFEAINTEEQTLTDLIQLLSNGDAKMVTGLVSSVESEMPFLWTDTPFLRDPYALLSRTEKPAMELNQILYSTIGLIEGSASAKTYTQWFPTSDNIIYYKTSDEAFKALENGEIDFLMSSQNRLLSQTNYREQPGFKSSITFDYFAETSFAFGNDEDVLRSIINKTQAIIDLEYINNNWTHKVFDYKNKLLSEIIPILIIFLVFASLSLLGLFLLHLKNKKLGKELEILVDQRTQELAEKTTTLSSIFFSIPDMIFCKDVNGIYTQVNQSLERFLNKSTEELVGKTRDQLFSDDIVQKTNSETDLEVLKTGETIIMEEHIYSPFLKKSRLFETIKTPLRKDGEIIGVMGIARDITERKAIEAAAQEASKAKSAFLAKVSHEIRTPLNAIIGMTRISRQSIDDKKKALESLDQINIASTHLLSLINDVLDMSKIESGKFEIEDEPFNLSDSLAEVSSIIGQRCREKYILFDSNYKDIEKLTICGDKMRLNQILINLLGNAVKFTPIDGTIHFLIDVLEQTAEQAKIKFTVADTGIGMTPQQISHLFVAFEQADRTIASKFGGTGLGLAISQNLVQLMGGEIKVESELEKGSSFFFTLDFKLSTTIIEDKKEIDMTNIDFSGKRILVAEDIDINRFILRELLEDTGIIMDEAENGLLAVEQFLKSPVGFYDLIFMDVQMPEMDGYSATKAIRASNHQEAKTIQIIAMTANAYQEDINKALAVGMNGHLSKPIDVEMVMKTLSNILKKKIN